MANDHLDSIDIAKGIGILLVISGHMLPVQSNFRNVIYTFHMPLFFILSGFVTNSKYGFMEILNSQKKMLATYFTYSTIIIVFDLVVKVFILREMNYRQIIWEFYQTFSLYGVNVLWFISTILLCRIILLILNWKISRNIILIITGCLYVIIGLFGTIFNMQYMSKSIPLMLLYFPIAALLRPAGVLVFMAVGFYILKPIAKLKQIVLNKSKLTIILHIIAIGLMSINIIFAKYSGFIDIHTIDFGKFPLNIFLAFSGSSTVILLSNISNPDSLISRCLSFLGKNSIFIMISHEYLLINRFVIYFTKGINYDHIIIQFIIVTLLSALLSSLITPKISAIINKLCLSNYSKGKIVI